jgi:hypothetical protein
MNKTNFSETETQPTPELKQEHLMNGTKRVSAILGIALCSAVLVGTSYGQPSVSVGLSVPVPSVQVEIRAESDFYEPLAPQGEWVVVGSYGRCWRPSHVARDWRPYCDGHWERTDAGWYWFSDEPWAWATYHYGRWDFTDQYGWYWVPQTQWAPAWVSWHEGGGYVGWAPLQPSVTISAGGYAGYSESRIPSRAYVFVEQRRFLDPIRPTTVVVNNTTVISKTTTISNTKIVNNTIINEGPATAVIEKASGRKVEAVPVQELRHKQEAAVAVKQRTPTAASEKKDKNVQTPVRTEVEPRGQKAVAAPAPAPVEKPAVAVPAPAPPTPTGRVTESEKARPGQAQPEPRLVTPQPEAIKEPHTPADEKHAQPSEKPPAKSEKKAPQKASPPKEKPAAAEQGHNQKAEEHPAPPEKPAGQPPPSP